MTANSTTASEYINNEQKDFALYVLQSRALPHIADGLKAASRRILWIARNGKKHKSATLAGATMPIHPHGDQSLQGAINTLAAPYVNNIPLLHGIGSFGTLLKPTAYGASRYTSVHTSKFTNDVMFRDIEIIPLVENYDETQHEPKHFLPLVPVVLLNYQEGIAVGFASKILPRDLEEIINDQICFLKDKKVNETSPYFIPTKNKAIDSNDLDDGNKQWIFRGDFERVNRTTIKITNLPYGMVHEKFIEKKLIKLEDEGKIADFEDNSRDTYAIYVKFKKGVLSNKTDEQIIKMFGLENTFSENMNMINFDGESVLSANYQMIIEKFTEWRLQWYYDRYKRLADLLEIEIQRYKDILLSIKMNVNSIAKKVNSKKELKDFLKEIGVVNIDYIADLPVYRFTVEEKEKTLELLNKAEQTMEHYKKLLNSEQMRKDVYITELKQIVKNYKKGYYDHT